MINQIFVSYDMYKKLQEYYNKAAHGINPNDLQGNCDHRKYDVGTDSCAICGKDWNTILWTGSGKPCCGGNSGQGPYFYSGGAWHASDCDTLKPPRMPEEIPLQFDYRPKPGRNRCECGGWATSNPNAHAFYCPEYKK